MGLEPDGILQQLALTSFQRRLVTPLRSRIFRLSLYELTPA